MKPQVERFASHCAGVKTGHLETSAAEDYRAERTAGALLQEDDFAGFGDGAVADLHEVDTGGEGGRSGEGQDAAGQRPVMQLRHLRAQ